MTDEPDTAELENRIHKLESTIEKMMPSRRDALKMGGAALVGGAAMSGTASAGTNQVGTIGSQSSPVDLESEDINNADTVTTENLVVNNTATGPFGGGGVVVESGDSITEVAFDQDINNQSFQTLYDDTAKDVLGGTIVGGNKHDFLYTFADDSTLKLAGTGTTYSTGINNVCSTENGDRFEVTSLPPALDVKKIQVGAQLFGSSKVGATVLLKD